MIHLTLQQLSAYLDGELTDASTELVRRHLSECDACTVTFARIEAQEEILARVLVDEPDDAFFRELKGSVAAAIAGGARGKAAGASVPSGRGKAAVAKAATPPKPVASLKPAAPPMPTPATTKKPDRAPSQATTSRAQDDHAHRAIPPAITPAPLPVIPPPEPPRPTRPAAPPEPQPVTVPLERPMHHPAPRAEARHPRRRAEDKPSHAVGWIAAVILVVLIGSAAWVLTRRAPSATDSPVPVQEASPPDTTTAPAQETPPPDDSEPPSEEPELNEPPIFVEPDVTQAPEPEPAPQPKRAAAKKVTTPPVDLEPEALVERPVQNVVPVRRVITERTYSSSTSEPETHPAPATPAPPSAASVAAHAAATRKRLMDDAKRVSLRAAQSKDAVAFDEAAAAWDKALPAVENTPEDLAVVHRERAQARFQAWSQSPTPARREAAVAAARAYLLYAPPGPERDQAWTWLGRLKK